ncbi:MAG: CPBP family intramembrane metalloprotease [SAR324 cluster bacterium]|nr:CPBP family intramembrane metalloprotease [SAR324 cluster bacterium]
MINNYRHTFRFYFLSAFIPWSLWLMAAYLSYQTDAVQNSFYISSLGLAGLCGPIFVAAYYISKDKVLLDDVAGRFINFRSDRKYYLLASLLLMPTSILLAMSISLMLGYDIGQFVITGQTTFSSSLFPVWLLLTIAPVLEELAWHSYGTDCLRQKFSLFTTSVIFAVYWALWHIPLAFIQGYYHNNLVEDGMLYSVNFLISIFPFVLLMNWLYYKTDRNILVAVVLHLTANVFNEIFATHPDSKVIQTGLLLLLSAYLLLTQRKLFFNKDFPDQSLRTDPRHIRPFLRGQYNA